MMVCTAAPDTLDRVDWVARSLPPHLQRVNSFGTKMRRPEDGGLQAGPWEPGREMRMRDESLPALPAPSSDGPSAASDAAPACTRPVAPPVDASPGSSPTSSARRRVAGVVAAASLPAPQLNLGALAVSPTASSVRPPASRGVAAAVAAAAAGPVAAPTAAYPSRAVAPSAACDAVQAWQVPVHKDTADVSRARSVSPPPAVVFRSAELARYGPTCLSQGCVAMATAAVAAAPVAAPAAAYLSRAVAPSAACDAVPACPVPVYTDPAVVPRARSVSLPQAVVYGAAARARHSPPELQNENLPALSRHLPWPE